VTVTSSAASITVAVAIGIIVAPRLHGPVLQRTGRWRCAVFGPSSRPTHYDV
jgi:hypothetical protein